MKLITRTIAFFTMLMMLSTSIFAEETKSISFKAKVEGNNVSIVESELTGEIDNSNLQVEVIKQIGEQSTVIYTGSLGGYDDGAWSMVDFSEIQFLVLFDWNTMENEAIFIRPIENITIDTSISKESTNEVAVYQNSVVQTVSGDINANISLLYDNAYSECILNAGEDLVAEVQVENTNETTATEISVMIALYDENSRMIGIEMDSGTVAANDTATIKPQITVPNNNTASSAKIMVWKSSNMMPYTNALTLTVSGNDFFGDDYNLAVNMDSRNSANGIVNSEDDFDLFEFEALKDGLYIFETYGTTDTYATLSNKETPTEIIKNDDNSGVDNNFRISATLEAGNSYYLKVGGHSLGKYKLVSNYAIGNIFGTVNPAKATGDSMFDNLIESKCSLYTFDSNEFVAQMYLNEYTSPDNGYANFSLIGVSAGDYLVKISRPGYLSRYSRITLNDNAVDLGNKTLIAGDVNDDGLIDSEDSNLLITALDSEYGEDKYIVSADFNGDKIVDSTDADILNANMGKTSNDYDENVVYIMFDVSVNNYVANITGKAKAGNIILCSIFRDDIFVSDQEINSNTDGSFTTSVELSQTGTYTIIATSDNRAFDVVKTIECN